MPRTEATVRCPLYDSFRVRQVAGMFDVPLRERLEETFSVEFPTIDMPWRIGLIVGPSGSGKSTIARRLFGNRLYPCGDWPSDRAVVDGLGDLPIKEITHLFTSVGFSSPPSWIKPYSVLSGGERFRCDLARALATLKSGAGPVRGHVPETTDQAALPGETEWAPETVVFDEFTSVVDRGVAKIGSAAVARALRGGRVPGRLVAVTCHYDVAEWLEPDWVLDMAVRRVARGCLRRPKIELEIVRCGREAWELFRRHHYLSGRLPRAARCFLAVWNDEPVAFCATVSLIGARGRWRVSRIVTLPDYQGIGIGMAVMETVCRLHREEGHRINATASHPAVVAHCRKSTKWKATRVMKTGSRDARSFIPNYRSSSGRAVVSFEYVG